MKNSNEDKKSPFKAEVLNRAEMKQVMGGLEAVDPEDGGLCWECLQDSDCTNGRVCVRIDNKFCDNGYNKTRCILPLAT